MHTMAVGHSKACLGQYAAYVKLYASRESASLESMALLRNHKCTASYGSCLLHRLNFEQSKGSAG